MIRRYLAAVPFLLLLAQPSLSRAATYQATLQRDEGGLPHVTANDWGGLGYGGAWAIAEDNFCRLADQSVTVRAERSRYFGPDARHLIRTSGANDSNLDSDLFYRQIIRRRVIEKLLRLPPPLGPDQRVKDLVAGWAAGYNAYRRSGELTDPTCAGLPWVKRIRPIDVWRRIYQLVLIASGGRFITGAVAAAPPASTASTPRTATPADAIDVAALRDAVGAVMDPVVGSNVFAVGADGCAPVPAFCSPTRTFPGSERSASGRCT